ncbi:hypothetical protein QJS10_CPB17g02485 [Acorus calamus]|uniref:Uncharacterized protein n=1 Tax=Acorus calamus TaxID=4465 RepID=A0AAV9CVW2_ACOCL|nr:hypothetical protein QJS10_CPB17g02485 [Acorus calamus]
MNPQPNPFGTTFSGAGSGFIRRGLSANGEKFLGSSSEFMQICEEQVEGGLVSIPSQGSGVAPLLDIVAYGGYAFTGGVLGENNEEGSLRRDEEPWFKQAELYAALHGCKTSPLWSL